MAKEGGNELKNECLLSQLCGDVAAIKTKMTPMEMEDIGKCDKPGQHILVEGSPGVGKTVMSWEICRQWAEGNMLQKWDIVLLLQLRSKRVRAAKIWSDLFYHDNDQIKKEVLEHISSLSGKGVFLLLEGFDELTDEENSLVNDLLTGVCLPKASIMVTNRPLASDSLCPEFRESVDQHLEIIGFDDEDIKSYVKAACKKQPQVLTKILSYIASNPFVSSVMCIPLQCAIVTALYIEKWNKEGLYAPTTLTQLYTDLIIYLLVRYMSNCRNFSQYKNISQLSELPSEIHDKVRQLSRLAAEGLKKKQFIFSSIPCDHMGFMQSAEEELVIGSSVSYCFLHLSLQEYLAALHWSKMDSEYLVRLVNETHLFPLDTLVRNEATEGHHYAALYFLSGLTKSNFLTSDSAQHKTPNELINSCFENCFTNNVFGLDFSSLYGRHNTLYNPLCNPNFFQFLFESQSHSLTSKTFSNQMISSLVTNPLEAFVTAWCITHSSPASRWNIRFQGISALEDFVEHFEKCHTDTQDYGSVVSLWLQPGSVMKAKDPKKLAKSLSNQFCYMENFAISYFENSATVIPLLSISSKLKSLKALMVQCYTNNWESELHLPPQYCPSLQLLTIRSNNAECNSLLFQSLFLPNFNTLSVLFINPLSSSDFDRLCTCLVQMNSLKFIDFMDTVKSNEESKLFYALKKNKSLLSLSINGTALTSKTAFETACVFQFPDDMPLFYSHIVCEMC